MEKTPVYRGKTKRKVRCRSGIFGYRCRLQTNYSNYNEFLEYCRIYDICKKLGYRNAKAAWQDNPIIEGSVNAYDYRKVSN